MGSSRGQVERSVPLKLALALALWLLAGLFAGAEARVLAVRPGGGRGGAGDLAEREGGTAAGQSRRRRRAVTVQALEGLVALRAEAAKLVSDAGLPATSVAVAVAAAALSAASPLDGGAGGSFSLEGFGLSGGAGLVHETVRLEQGTNVATNRSGIIPFENLADGPPTQLPANSGEDEGLELQLPGASLRELHDKSKESVAEFLLILQNCLDRGVHVDARVTSLTERFRIDTSDEGQQKKHNPVVVVKLQAKQFIEGTNMSAHEMAVVLTAQLEDQQCDLRTSDFGFAMDRARVRPSSPLKQGRPRAAATNLQAVSAMALPVIASAVFTGMLLWMAAW